MRRRKEKNPFYDPDYVNQIRLARIKERNRQDRQLEKLVEAGGPKEKLLRAVYPIYHRVVPLAEGRPIDYDEIIDRAKYDDKGELRDVFDYLIKTGKQADDFREPRLMAHLLFNCGMAEYLGRGREDFCVKKMAKHWRDLLTRDCVIEKYFDFVAGATNRKMDQLKKLIDERGLFAELKQVDFQQFARGGGKDVAGLIKTFDYLYADGHRLFYIEHKQTLAQAQYIKWKEYGQTPCG